MEKYSLVHYLGEICRSVNGKAYGLEEWENEQGKEVFLFISHELSLTGAPLALLSFAEFALQAGKQAVIFSKADGPIRDDYTKRGTLFLFFQIIWKR